MVCTGVKIENNKHMENSWNQSAIRAQQVLKPNLQPHVALAINGSCRRCDLPFVGKSTTRIYIAVFRSR